MSRIRAPKSTAAAQDLLGHYAELAEAAAHIETIRNGAIARANESADAELAPLLEELEQLRGALQPWWDAAGADLAKGKKSVQLAGCKIGYRTSRPKLAHDFGSDELAVEALMLTRHVRQTTKIRYTLDRTGTLKLLELGGKAGQDVAALGFRIDQAENFFVDRVEQDATIKP